MTGNILFLENLRSYTSSHVTFGDGAKGKILGVGNLINNGLPKLEKVLLVKGLTVNLISISQLCDEGLKVNFTKDECLVTDKAGKTLMKGTRSTENCYAWVSHNKNYLLTCLISKEEEA